MQTEIANVNKEVDWDKEPTRTSAKAGGHILSIAGMSKEDIDSLSPVEATAIGQLDDKTLEAIVVGYLIHDRDISDVKDDRRNAELISASAIRSSWFSDRGLGILYDRLLGYYREHKACATLNEIRADCEAENITADKARVYEDVAADCHAMCAARGISADIVIRRFVSLHEDKTVTKLVKEYRERRNDERFGPKKAIEGFRIAVAKELADPESAIIKERDWILGADETIGRMLDMKHNPEKYEGLRCGIPCIDNRTSGFRAGQLTVFIGRTGGYKSTLMMNIALKLWMKGLDVLYASFEMEQWVVETKLWCMYARVSYSKCLNGLVSEPGDRAEIAALQIIAEDAGRPEEERRGAGKKLARLRSSGILDTAEGAEDSILLKKAKLDLASRKNKFIITTAGQSQKIKIGQLEAYIVERKAEWQPKVVCVDYLDHVDSDAPHDRKDLEIGEVTKRLRTMGSTHDFTTITAAQFKRGVVERVRDAGDNAEKAGLSTEDIANAQAIGNDADTVFMLWPEEGGSRVRVFTPKARFGAQDPKGALIQVDVRSHFMDEKDIESTDGIISMISPAEVVAAATDLAEGKIEEVSTDEEKIDMGYYSSDGVDSGDGDEVDPLADPKQQGRALPPPAEDDL